MTALKFITTISVSLLLLLLLILRVIVNSSVAGLRYLGRQLNRPSLGALRILSYAKFHHP